MNKGKILLVDDEEGIRKVLSISLADSGYQVLTAENGERALEQFRQEQPEIVLTDIKMPGMDGIELLRKIKAQNADAEVIMITGHGDMDLAVKSLQSDAADFITKPINDSALEVALKRVHERMDLKRKLQEYTQSLEAMVEAKTRELLQAERLAAIGQTVATLAHSIKNIIGGLKGGMFVLEKGMELGKREYLQEGWRMVRGNVEKINNLALDLLNYAGERSLRLQPTDPNEPLRDVFQLMEQKAAANGVVLKMELSPDLPAVRIDAESIHCCLLNLVTNALDACTEAPACEGAREILLRSRKSPDGAIEYEVRDNGCGMDAETRERVFRCFFTTKGTRGTGLGLMITQKIVGEHGGSITLDSQKGKGTRFTIRLPISP